MKKCPFCAEPIQEEAIKCRFCGSQLNTIKNPKRKPTRTQWYVTFVLVLIGLWWINDFFTSKIAGQLEAKEQAQKSKIQEDVIESLPGHEAHNRISALSNQARNSFFTTILKKSGEKCDVVIRNFFKGHNHSDDKAYWDIACKNKHAYSIAISKDDLSNRIVNCKVLEVLNAVECFKKFD